MNNLNFNYVTRLLENDLQQFCESKHIDYLTFLERSRKNLSKEIDKSKIDYTLLINDVVEDLTNSNTLINSAISEFSEFKSFLKTKISTVIHLFQDLVVTLSSDEVIKAIVASLSVMAYIWVKEYLSYKEFKGLDDNPRLSFTNTISRLYKRRPDIMIKKYEGNYKSSKYEGLLHKFVPSHPVAIIDVDLSVSGFTYEVKSVRKSVADALSVTPDKLKSLIKQVVNKEIESERLFVKDLDRLVSDYDIFSNDWVHFDQTVTATVNDIVTLDVIKPRKAITIIDVIAMSL